MKCKPLALRVLSTAAMLSIVASCAAPAFAATYDLNNGSVSVRAEADGKQYVSQWKDKESNEYAKDEKGEINHREDHDVTLTSNGRETENTIEVGADEGQEAKVTLSDVDIDTRQNKEDKTSDGYKNSEGDTAMKVTGAGDVTVELDGNNTLTSGAGNAGLQKNRGESTGTLTIQDETGEKGSLSATGGMYGAGIGGSINMDTATGHGTEKITITGGEITATGGNEYNDGNQEFCGGAGIGGSVNANGDADSAKDLDVSDITISGGTVTATGGTGSAGIGGGNNYMLGFGAGGYDDLPEINVKDITITGGEVHAKGGNMAAGIGGGYISMGDVSGIHISGVSDSTVEGGSLAAGIGGGAYEPSYDGTITPKGTVSDIRISDSKLTIKAGSGGTGIGTGAGPTLADDALRITDSDITIRKIKSSPYLTKENWPDGSYIGVGGCFGEDGSKVNGTETDVSVRCGSTITCVDAQDGTESVEKTIDRKEHTWGEWTTVKEATATETGLRQRVCSVCGKTDEEEIPMLTPSDTENTAAPELQVVTPDAVPQAFQVTQNGTVRTYESPYDSGTLTGTMETLQYLQQHGTETIVFTTNQRTSSFAVADLLALAGEGDVFTLSHVDAGAPTLRVAENDHTGLLA